MSDLASAPVSNLVCNVRVPLAKTATVQSVVSGSNTLPASLANFQQHFGRFLRHQSSPKNDHSAHSSSSLPESHSTTNSAQDTSSTIQYPTQPIHSVARVTALYRSLVFNNVCGFIDKCFPVCQSLISAEKWQIISELFFKSHACHSPYFTEINQSFVDFLSEPEQLTRLELPPYFAELAHYEWVELLVDTQVLDTLTLANLIQDNSQTLATLEAILVLNPSLQNLHYSWPVHLLSVDNNPTEPEDSFFLVYRNQLDTVQFMQINALTYALIEHLELNSITDASSLTITNTLKDFAESLGYADHEVLVNFGIPLIEQLIEHQVIWRI